MTTLALCPPCRLGDCQNHVPVLSCPLPHTLGGTHCACDHDPKAARLRRAQWHGEWSVPTPDPAPTCRNCGEEIVFESYYRDGLGPNPPIWWHPRTRTTTCSVPDWPSDDWPVAEPEPEPELTQPRWTEEDVREAINLMLDLGFHRNFEDLVDDGARGDEVGIAHTGDDLASLCHALRVLAEFHQVPWRGGPILRRRQRDPRRVR